MTKVVALFSIENHTNPKLHDVLINIIIGMYMSFFIMVGCKASDLCCICKKCRRRFGYIILLLNQAKFISASEYGNMMLKLKLFSMALNAIVQINFFKHIHLRPCMEENLLKVDDCISSFYFLHLCYKLYDIFYSG
ncbi:hypothetical protein EDC96DRAFT_547920 [Choanephora cucurbitarum]|nr:hypothetical protein EDC96DRAFT_547920 [Choanephora cucurbitarum]